MIHRTRIKVCGITDQADLDHAVAAGVDALGFIFASKSPRQIDPDKARELIKSVPPFVEVIIRASSMFRLSWSKVLVEREKIFSLSRI